MFTIPTAYDHIYLKRLPNLTNSIETHLRVYLLLLLRRDLPPLERFAKLIQVGPGT